ncbi:polysaccharide lyase 8 family protein [Priestia megaterium]|uniref:Polysaccharide lyase 8 family protein n=1 Tax=Priestia megaterium TaxID=1404 RepID=A0A6H1P0V8_PRIMG|nr:polysaccharide lyase 8 family protein [Priestia megaterium]QIZ07186.1 polysaccharide lyase 8 family protein [Priestia megaterium]
MPKQLKRKSMILLMVSMLLLSFISVKNIAQANTTDAEGGQSGTMDAFDQARARWFNKLTGNEQYNPNDPDINEYLLKLTNRVTNPENKGSWDTLNKTEGRTYLWENLVSTKNSAEITSAYNNLKDMALAYSIKGSSLYQNKALKVDLISALDWMYAYRYNEQKSEYGNWWDWEIGTPKRLNDIMVLLYDELAPTQLNNYISTIDQFDPNPKVRTYNNAIKETGANLLDKIFIANLRGVIGKNDEKVTQGHDALLNEYLYVDHGDGVYKDGSLVQHFNIAYTGSYGAVWLTRTADILYLLKDSKWPLPQVDNIYNWVSDTFEPVIYKGAVMDMVNGRSISRQYENDHDKGRTIILSLLNLANAAPQEKSTLIKRLVKVWIQTDTTFPNYTAGLSIYDINLVKSLMADSTIQPRGELLKNQVLAGMDRVVHLRPGFGFGISMFSDRISAFEYGNGENSKGWYTGIGMTSLYNNDLKQFKNDFWPTVDSFRLPGTTTDGSKGVLKDWNAYYNSRTWAGGSTMDGLYGSAGMDFSLANVTGSSLQGKKSWFMFDDEIVAFGSDIKCGDNRKVETIVENRQLRDAGDNQLTVNGETKPSSLGWSEPMENVKWAHLEGNVPNSDIGYYFPESARIDGLREARTGSWRDINNGGLTTPISRNYLSLAFNHGINPQDASYSYVLLPNKSKEEVEAFSQNPNVTILSNTKNVHSVKETTLGITAANFFAPGTADIITAENPSSVMVKEEKGELSLSVSDPTQKQDKVIIDLDKTGVSVISKDDTVNVLQTFPTIKVEINVAGSIGTTHVVKFQVDELKDIERLDQVIDFGNQSGWIKNEGIYNSLDSKVNQIQKHKDDSNLVNEGVKALENQVRAQFGNMLNPVFANFLLSKTMLLESHK